MENKINTKLIILSILFLLTCVFVYSGQETVQVSKQPIRQYLGNVDNYKTIQHIMLEDNALNMLKLDDYLYVDYEGKNGKVNLYIGYYYTAGKAYAAHSPLICYPSQGWKIDEQSFNHTVNVGTYLINYDEITTSLRNQKELVLFWYQAHHHTNTHIVNNKIDMGVNKFFDNNEQHAFVRVSVPLEGVTLDQAQKSALDFIRAFYPQFIHFIDEG